MQAWNRCIRTLFWVDSDGQISQNLTKSQHDACIKLCTSIYAWFRVQLTDSHTTEYIARLREEPILLALADKAIAYFQRVRDTRNVAFVALRQAEHFYYKTETVYAAMRNLVEASKASGVDPADVKATPTEPVATGAENKSARANGIVGMPRCAVSASF